MVEEIGGNILRGISNTLNASADLADEHYRELSEQERRKRVRRMLTTPKDVEIGFVKVTHLQDLQVYNE